MIEAALVFDEGIVGMIDESTTRNDAIPWTFKFESTTAMLSLPILQVPTG